MRKILQLCEPLVKAWPENNFLSSIVQTKKTGYSWLMNTHIQTYGSLYINELYGINEIRETFYPFANLRANVYDLCPFIRKYVIPRKEVVDKYDKFTDFIVRAINNERYIFTMINEYFREDTPDDFNHPCYFYGYDLERKKIYCADNFGKGKYQQKEISFEVIDTAFDNYKIYNWEAGVILYQLMDYSFKDNPDFIADQIKDYLEPGNICYLNRFFCPDRIYHNGPESGEIFFGVECYKLLKRLVLNYIDSKELGYVDIRSFAFICDHKNMMQYRNDYLEKRGIISTDLKICDLYDSLIEDCEMLLHLMLKVKVSCRKEYLVKALEMLKIIQEKDIICMNNLLERISI